MKKIRIFNLGKLSWPELSRFQELVFKISEIPQE